MSSNLQPMLQTTDEPPRGEGDDDLGDLPPIDGDAGEEAGAPLLPMDDDLDLGSEGEHGPEALDDRTAEDAPLSEEDQGDLDGDERDDGWLAEPAENPDLDVGGPALSGSVLEEPPEGNAREHVASDDDGPEAIDEDVDFGEIPGATGLDSTAEVGPLDPDEELREEDLPALDADAGDDDERDSEDEGEDAILLDEGASASGLPGLPWSAAPWAPAGAPIALSGA
ncbi:MAG: hypothetical protein ACREJ3_14025, partial [Polyangiaceae bacterium]